MKKVVAALCCMWMVVLCGCALPWYHNQTEDGYKIYYLNSENTKIVEVPYELQTVGDVSGQIDELLAQLQQGPDDVKYSVTIEAPVEILDYQLEGSTLSIYFSADYLDMTPAREALSRAAIVKTLTQLDGVECFSFFVENEPLMDRNGNPIGVMTADTFVENPGEQINSIQEADIKLYFANTDGKSLVAENRKVPYSTNISMEKLIMEQLLEGPEDSDLKSAIPEGTKLVNVSVLDGVCYVSLDETFQNQDYNIDESVVIFSIVNSLSELSGINKVQISINGDTSGVYRDSFALDTLYERDIDYVKEKKAEEENTE